MDSTKLRDLASRIVHRAESSFQPTEPQRRAKSAFWGAIGSQDVVTPGDTPDLALALRFSGTDAVQDWWDQPRFQSWFWNRAEFEQSLEYVAVLALRELESVLASKSMSQDKKIPAIKLALEVSGKLANARGDNEPAVVDEKIRNMDRKQLEQYISSKITKLAVAPNIPLTDTPDSASVDSQGTSKRHMDPNRS